jgi:lipopolysaccharide export system protein LptA
MQDAQGGAGTATATFAQHGSSAGGAITDTESTATITAQVSLTIARSNAVSGAMVIDYADGTTCTFSTAGSYNASTNVLSGSYSAVTNCAGDTGTYSLTQQCTDTITSADRRTMGLPPHC